MPFFVLRSACFRHVLLKFHSSLRLAGQVPDSYLGYHPPRLQRPRLWLGRRSLQHRGARLEVNHSLPPLRCLHGDARGHWCCAPVLAGQPCHMHVGLLVTKRASHAMAHPWCIISPHCSLARADGKEQHHLRLACRCRRHREVRIPPLPEREHSLHVAPFLPTVRHS